MKIIPKATDTVDVKLKSHIEKLAEEEYPGVGYSPAAAEMLREAYAKGYVKRLKETEK